jgi:WD40 repeat protein
MRAPLVLVLLCCGAPLAAQVPDTDVFLTPLSRHGDSLIVGRAVNITHRPGYDNQPEFLLDRQKLLYTSIGSDGQADIWRYDLVTHETTRLTSTPESEYSPTVIPRLFGGRRRFSVIRVERDSTQRLWTFDEDGGDPLLLVKDLKPVGYHDWLDSVRIVAYVLGSPSTLHVLDADGTHDEVRARDVGRSIHMVPKRGAFSFTARDSAGVRWIMMQSNDGHAATRLVSASPDNEYHAWTADDMLLTTIKDVLVRWDDHDRAGPWLPMADLRGQGVRGVSRLAVSPDGRWLAFVAEPAAP